MAEQTNLFAMPNTEDKLDGTDYPIHDEICIGCKTAMGHCHQI